MDSGIIFDHDDRASMGSMMTKVYMNNNMAASTNRHGNMVVNSFSATRKLISAPNNPHNSNSPNPPMTTESMEGEDAVNSGNENLEGQQELPLPLGTGIIGAREE